MSKTMIDLDHALVNEAAKILGTATIKETVHVALRRVAQQTAHLETVALFAGLDEEHRGRLKKARDTAW